nr:MAG TPA: hypothetical protein [Caudoviricetes sp.]
MTCDYKIIPPTFCRWDFLSTMNDYDFWKMAIDFRLSTMRRITCRSGAAT